MRSARIWHLDRRTRWEGWRLRAIGAVVAAGLPALIAATGLALGLAPSMFALLGVLPGLLLGLVFGPRVAKTTLPLAGAFFLGSLGLLVAGALDLATLWVLYQLEPLVGTATAAEATVIQSVSLLFFWGAPVLLIGGLPASLVVSFVGVSLIRRVTEPTADPGATGSMGNAESPDQPRHRDERLVALVLVVSALAFLVAACGAGPETGTPTNPTECRTIASDTVEAVSWSPSGDFLGVLARVPGGETHLIAYAWPSMGEVSDAATGTYSADVAAIDDEGAVYWATTDPMSQQPVTTIWRQVPGGQPAPIRAVSAFVLSLQWSKGLIGHEVLGNAQRLVRYEGDGGATVLRTWTDRASSQWIDRSGEWIVWMESEDAGSVLEVVVSHDGRDQRHPIPGYGGRAPTVIPDGSAVMYQRSETARLTLLDVQSGLILGEVDNGEFFGGEISSRGILAAPTGHGPGERNELCVLDVSARLAALQASPEIPASDPLPPEDLARRDTFVAAIAAATDGTLPATIAFGSGWETAGFFPPYMDNVAARHVLDTPFDLEAAVTHLDGADGIVVVLTGRDRPIWFAVPAALVDMSRVARGGIGAAESLCVSDTNGLPRVTGLC